MDLFWAKVRKTEKCWLWTAAIFKNDGYGMFANHGRTTRAHRLSWESKYGPIPKGLSVLHKCDTPLCVRPSHLFLGTQKDNVQDARKKGRLYHARGTNNGHAILTDAKVLEIRKKAAEGTLHRVLAEEYGVVRTLITHVVARKRWTHV